MSETQPESQPNPPCIRSPAAPRFSTLFALLSVTLLMVLLHRVAVTPGADIAQGAQLLLSTTELQANTSFELRFDEAVAASEELDQPGARVPLEVAPPLRGDWVWLSRRSGVFTPAEPMELGTRYTFELRAGLRTAVGAKVDARMRRSFATPAFTAMLVNLPTEHGAISARPALQVRFNALVQPAEAAVMAEFRSENLRVSAQVEGAQRIRTWRGQFSATNAVELATQAEDDDPSLPEIGAPPLPATAKATNNAFAALTFSPVEPLAAGRDWTFVLRAGLRSPETAQRGAERAWKLGRVVPFALTNVAVESSLNAGRRLALAFSQPPASGVETNFADWFTVTPAPAQLRCERDHNGVLRLRGEFALDTEYTVATRAGLPADDGQPLGGNETYKVRFQPLTPAAWFPAFDTAQLARGGRDFQLLALNAPRVRVRAKLLDRHTLIHGLRGYQGYLHGEPDESGRRSNQGFTLDWNAVPGRTVFDQILKTDALTDHARRVPLPWEKLLRTNSAASVVLFAEPEVNGKFVPGPQAVIQLTDLGVAWKQAGNETLTWVFSHATGRPVANALVQFVTDEHVELAAARTDERGLARLPMQRPDRSVWLLAEAGEDRHALRLDRWETSVPLYRFRLPYEGDFDAGEGEPLRALLFTDRDVYRPGETVQLKAIARQWRGEEWRFPAKRKVTLQVNDARGEALLTTNLTFSTRGSLDFALPLPGGPRGEWSFTLQSGQQNFHAGFQVRDFKPNAFEITLDAPREFAASEPVRVPVGARYLLGQPLTRADVSWELEARDANFAPEGWRAFTFCGDDYRLDALGLKRGAITLHDKTRLAAGTNLVLTPAVTLNAQLPCPRTVRLLAEVTDLNQQTRSHAADFTVHSSDFYLGVRDLVSPRVGQPLSAALVAVRPDGSPMPAPVKATLRLQRVEWHTVRQLGAGKAIAYRSEPVFTNLVEQEVVTLPARRVGVKWELADKATPALLPAPTEAGEYLLEARATDAAGRAVLTAIPFHVTNPEPKSARKFAWDYRNDVQVELVPDRKSYRAGDTATVLVKTPISGAALVTIERDGVRREWTTNLVGNAPVLRIPLEPGDAPNVFVGVLLLRGHADSPRQFPQPEYRIGYCQLRVEQPEHRLQVSVMPAAPDARPGQPVRMKVAVQDHTARAVAGAEVTLYAVDEGVLSLTGYVTPDPFEFFHQPRPLAVRTDISLPTLLPEDPELRSFQNKGHFIGGGGRDAVRRNFQPVAFWSASMLTDKRGEISASFTAPDSLTRYRVIAVAHAGRTQFGSGTADFEVNKPLMLEPSLPRFAHVGDQLVARAVALNKTDSPGDVEVTLQLDSLAVAPRLTNRIAVAAHAAVPVDFPVTILADGSAKWLWRARFIGPDATAFADTVESTLLVKHPAPLRREVRFTRITNASTDLLLGLDPKVFAGRGNANVRVASSQLIGLGECIRQLLHYPYGCLEQTTSSTLPWLVLREMPDLIPRDGRMATQLDAAIAAGVQRLLSMQTGDGGLSYWPGGREPQFWGSAYGALLLVLARDAGVPVPERALAKLLTWLRGQLDHSGRVTGSGALAERCLALYTLARAGKPAASHHEVLFQCRDWLTPEDRTLLALAVQHAEGPRPMVEELLNGKTPARPSRGAWFGCDAREQALQLLAWVKFQPDAPIVDQLAAGLLRGQRAAHWGTTQGNAWALLALVAYADAIERETGAVAGELKFAETRQPFNLGLRSALEQGFSFSPTNSPQLSLMNPERKPCSTLLTVESRAEQLDQAPLDRGFRVTRMHERLDDENKPAAGPWRVGDRVLVTLRVEARERAEWVAIEDPLPAVLEAVTPEFKSDQTRGASAIRAGWWADHRELRQDRMLYFRNQLAQGTHVIQYLARVRAAGDATAPSAKVEAMYQPERVGLSGSARVKAE